MARRIWLVSGLSLFALALAVRLLYILVIAPAPVGVGGDAGFYASAARLIAHGHFYERTIFNRSYQTAEHPPLYPLVLAVLSPLSGTGDAGFRVVGCMLGSLGVLLIALLGWRLAGPRAGILAGALAAVYPPLITADGLIMSEPLFTVLVALTLLAALRLRRAATLAGAARLGGLVGLATLTRGEGLLMIPFLLAPAVWRPTAGRLPRLGVALLVAALTLAPWVIRNGVEFDRVILATDSNTLLAGANCHATYYGHDIGWWSMRCLKRARTRRQLSTGDANPAKAIHYAEHHLIRLPLVALARVARTFDFLQPLRQGNQEPRRRWFDVAGLLLYYPVLGLGLLGLRRIGRRRDPDRPIALLVGPVWMVVVVSMLGWGIGRFRIAADIVLLVGAAAALAGAGFRAQPTATLTTRLDTVPDGPGHTIRT